MSWAFFGEELNKNQMFAIEGGLAEPVANLLGGTMTQLSDKSSDAINGNPLLTKIDTTAGSSITAELLNAVNGGQVVLIASFNTTNEPVTNEIQWTEKHAFAAFDPEPLNPNNTTIQIYNPWGFSTKSQQNNPSNPYLSPFVIEASDVATQSGFFFFTRAAAGSAADDVVFGSDRSDGLDGSSGDDFLNGLDGDDTLLGGKGNDSLSGGASSDILDGGAGVDIALYANAASAYKLSLDANKISLTDPSGSEGTDTLTNIERLKFSDKLLAIDLDGNAGTTAKILGAVFGKAAITNKAYAGIGLHYLNNLGYSYEQLMGLAINAALGPTPTHGQVVDLLYKNVVVGVLPDATT